MGAATQQRETDPRWRRRPGWAAAVEIGTVAVPVGAGLGATLWTSHVVDRPTDGAGVVLWWALLLGTGTATAYVIAALCRRGLPLAGLFKLSLAFPDRVPSRVGVALRTGTVRNLQQRVESLRRGEGQRSAGDAAAQILVLAGALASHDPRTRGHVERVRALADVIGEELRLGPEERDRLRWGALLHDCGKLAVRPEVLNKKTPLTDDEWQEIRRHPDEGLVLAAPLAAWMGDWVHAIDQHHEKWDGSGYPNGLRGEEIALGARIIAVADAFDVMTSARSYKAPLPAAAARAELARMAGAQFDPVVVRALLNVSIGRLRWLVGPLTWVGGAPIAGVRWAAMAAQSTAGTAVLASVVAAAVGGGLGLWSGPSVDAPARERAAAVASPDVRITPRGAPRVAGVTIGRPDAPPPAVETARGSAAVGSAPSGAGPAVAGPGSGSGPGPSGPALSGETCTEHGVLSAPIHDGGEPLVGALLAPAEPVVHGANCGVVVPIEDLVGAILEPVVEPGHAAGERAAEPILQAANGTDSKPCTLLMCTLRRLPSSTS